MFRLLLGSLGLALGLLAFGGTAKADFTMTCESFNGMYRFCAVDTKRGVKLVQQISNAPCVFNQSWGFVRSGIWVTVGCRGVFRVETGGGNQGQPDRVKDIVADGIMRGLVDQDKRDGRLRADATRACVRYAQDYELNRNAKSIFVTSVTVHVRGQQSYAVRFLFEAKYHKQPKTRYFSAKCGVKNGEVQSYDRQ
jgi:hypothetical protein